MKNVNDQNIFLSSFPHFQVIYHLTRFLTKMFKISFWKDAKKVWRLSAYTNRQFLHFIILATRLAYNNFTKQIALYFRYYPVPNKRTGTFWKKLLRLRGGFAWVWSKKPSEILGGTFIWGGTIFFNIHSPLRRYDFWISCVTLWSKDVIFFQWISYLLVNTS